MSSDSPSVKKTVASASSGQNLDESEGDFDRGKKVEETVLEGAAGDASSLLDAMKIKRKGSPTPSSGSSVPKSDITRGTKDSLRRSMTPSDSGDNDEPNTTGNSDNQDVNIDEKFESEFPTPKRKSWKNESLTLIGFAMAVVVLIWSKYRWILREFYMQGEGHSVCKTLVCLLFLYSYSCIVWGLEFFHGLNYVLELAFPSKYYRVKEWVLQRRMSCLHLDLICTNFTVLGAPLFCKIGCMIWDYMWKFYVCKSYHDQSCRKSWIGQSIYSYRNAACYDGKASSAVCERFISYLPLIITTCFAVLIGNLILPVINDYLHGLLSQVKADAQDRLFEKVCKSRKSDSGKLRDSLQAIVEEEMDGGDEGQEIQNEGVKVTDAGQAEDPERIPAP